MNLTELPFLDTGTRCSKGPVHRCPDAMAEGWDHIRRISRECSTIYSQGGHGRLSRTDKGVGKKKGGDTGGKRRRSKRESWIFGDPRLSRRPTGASRSPSTRTAARPCALWRSGSLLDKGLVPYVRLQEEAGWQGRDKGCVASRFLWREHLLKSHLSPYRRSLVAHRGD